MSAAKNFAVANTATKLFITVMSVIFDDNILSPSVAPNQRQSQPIVTFLAAIG
jgi:hypothetical protein